MFVHLRRILTGLLILVLIVSVYACGSKDDDSASDGAASQSEDVTQDPSEGMDAEDADIEDIDEEENENFVPTEEDLVTFVGSWTSVGMLLSDGSIEKRDDGITITINEDGTAKDTEGRSGRWSLSDDKLIITAEGEVTSFKIDDNDNLLLSSSERDGKGNILKYVLSKN